MSFINDDFMLQGKAAKQLYHDYAEKMPIIDYHCHLNPQLIAQNYKFKNAYDLFLSGDHYKWRQMRSNGIDERYITGDADDYEKFLMFAKTLPLLIGNPLYHWTHLELKRYFNIDEILTEESAREIWEECNLKLSMDEFRVKSLIQKSNVEAICTTDDPADSLEYHKQIKNDNFTAKVYPTFRPDKIVDIDNDAFISYINSIGVHSYEDLLSWISSRILFFNENGCRLSDHALKYVPFAVGNAKEVFEKKLNGAHITDNEVDVYKTAVLMHCASEFTKYDWAMQLHIGALRNNNKKMFEKLGPDTGFDSINDAAIAENLSRLLGLLESESILPKTILYTLNPKDNYVLGTMIGNFQSGPTASKIQFGSGWWFNDQRDGMEQQLKALGNLGVLGNFVGMLTDSRSFVSYTRHEYFRRILCDLIGNWVDKGEYPNNQYYLKQIIEGICYKNAKIYFELD